jgi:toxin ParE1/3/4
MKRAYRDLDSIYGYIAYENQAPENVQEQIDRIKTSVLGLYTLPQSHQDRLVGRYAGKGYKQLLVDNYVAIFRIDESKKAVWVVTIQYQGSNL